MTCNPPKRTQAAIKIWVSEIIWRPPLEASLNDTYDAPLIAALQNVSLVPCLLRRAGGQANLSRATDERVSTGKHWQPIGYLAGIEAVCSWLRVMH